MSTLTKGKRGKTLVRAAGPILYQEITRESIKSGSRTLKGIISAALNNAPKETSFEVVVIPSGIVQQSNDLSAAIAHAINHPRKRTLQNKARVKHANVFDPYEAGQLEVMRLQKSEGGAWSGQDLARLFDLSFAVLHRRRKEFRIIYWRDARGEFHYPKWQFNPAGAVLHGVDDVLQIFRSLDEWRVIRYFLNPRRQLDNKRPIDLLRDGKIENVILHARNHAKENTW
jgi:hypothetical protein